MNDELKAYDPTWKQILAEKAQAGLESLGFPRYKARQHAQTVFGGESSRAPLGMGAIDATPLGVPFWAQEAGLQAGTGAGQIRKGDIGEGLVNLGSAALTAAPIPGVIKKTLGTPQARAALRVAHESGTPIVKIPAKGVPMDPAVAAHKYMRENLEGKAFNPNLGMSAPSNAERQAWIGKAHAAGAEGSQAYKDAVYNAYVEQRPDIIAATGARNYDELAAASYKKVAEETAQQFDTIPNAMEYWTDPHYMEKDYLQRARGTGEAPASLIHRELTAGEPFAVYRDVSGSQGHPGLSAVDPNLGINANEKFRAVHDYYGHVAPETPNAFGPKGEENAWLTHRQMYSPVAEPAMTAETRGQNSFVNYVDPENVALRAEGKPTVNFAKNVPVILPPEASNPEYVGGVPAYLQHLIK
jgi:hypothetical protein